MQKLRCYGLSTEWNQRYPTFEAICSAYSPANWEYVANRPAECYKAENPALVALNDIYANRDVAKSWIQIQISAYALTRNVDDTIVDAIPLFASNFANMVGRYKLLEIMLFFARLTSGHYKTYGKFELRQIGEAWGEFLKERSIEIERISNEDAIGRMEALYQRKDAMTIDEYNLYKPWWEAGYSVSEFRQYRKRIERWLSYARCGWYATTL